MARFSNQFLSYYPDLPKGPSSKKMVFLPIWIWRIFAPVVSRKTEINIFQKIILELLHVGRQDRQQLAEWIGVEIELIDLIIDTELMDDKGWIVYQDQNSKKITLTEKGLQELGHETERIENVQAYYLIQDAITGQLWPRLLPNDLKFLEVFESENHKIRIQSDLDSGTFITPFVMDTQLIEPKEPTSFQITQSIKKHNFAMRANNIRIDKDDGKYLNSTNLKNYTFHDKKPEAFFILTHLKESLDYSSHLCQIQDPCHVSEFDDWIQNFHIELAQKHKLFSAEIKKFLKSDMVNEETVEEFEERILQEMALELVIDFPFANKIDNLNKYLNKLLARKKNLVEKENYYDVDDLVIQCQKALELCFKHMLRQWPHQHANTLPRQLNRNQIKSALKMRLGNHFSDTILDQLKTVNSTHVFSANGYSAKTFSQTNVSLKPLIVSNLLCVLDYPNHPLILREQFQVDLDQLIQLCDRRNESSHASGYELDVQTALNFAEFTLNWISFYTTTAIEA